jgi:hypothetical protein
VAIEPPPSAEVVDAGAIRGGSGHPPVDVEGGQPAPE